MVETALLLKTAASPLTTYTGGLYSSWRRTFHHRIPVFFERGDYTVKTVSSRREFLQVMKLRYEVFHKEYKNKKFPLGLDKDEYDALADHLVIIDNKIGKIVGTYRLICSKTTTDFYSRTEFDISDFDLVSGTKVELSRACIHKDYRTGSVIALLWRGLTQYIQACGAKYLFGLASVKTTDAVTATKFCRYFADNNHRGFDLDIKSVAPFSIPEFDFIYANVEKDEGLKEEVPTLVKSYLRAGAKIYGDPAIDRDFNCTDFFMIMDLSKLSETYERKFQVN